MDTFKFECPDCKHVHTTSVTSVGKKAKCSRCGTRMVIPDDGSEKELAARATNQHRRWQAEADSSRNELLEEIAKNTRRTAEHAGCIFWMLLGIIVLSFLGAMLAQSAIR